MLWNVKATVIPVVTGALGRTNDNHKNHLRTTGIPITTTSLQKAALLGTAFILRRVLVISESR